MRLSDSFDCGIIDGTVERISFAGEIKRDRTVLFYLGKKKISKRALIIGLLLVTCHIMDGFLTFFGMEFFGTDAEGNFLLRNLMEQIGHGGALFVAKSAAVAVSLWLMLLSHQRLWVRTMIAICVCIYLVMAIFPWCFIISRYLAEVR